MTTVSKIKPHVASITAPKELRELPAWLMWRYEHEEGLSKPRKMPYYTSGEKRHGVQGRPEDRAQLTTFEAARAAAARRGFDGVGLAILPDWGLCALDFDNCVSPTGQVHPDITAIAADTYAEFSPSGTGVRVFVRGAFGNRKDPHAQPYGLETFTTKGFVTVTGNALPITNMLGLEDAIAVAGPKVVQLLKARFGSREHADNAGAPPLALSLTQIAQALDVLDPSMPHDGWLQVGMALHHETRGDGFHLWDTWSQGGHQYPGSEALQDRWDSFGRFEGPSVTARTLVKMANEAGAYIVLNGPASALEFEMIGQESAMQNPDGEGFPVIEAGAEPASRFAPQHWSEFMGRPAPKWIVKGVVPQASLMVVYGESGSGKTFAVLDLVLAIARGDAWRGLRTRQGRVVYVCAEGQGGFRNRLVAVAQARSLDPASIPLDVISVPPNLLDRNDALEVARAIGRADIVVVDTWAQVTPGANENSGEDMGKALAHCSGIHRATGALVILVHHSGKDTSKGARGWSGLRAAADAELEVLRMPTARVIRTRKQKDGDDGAEWGFNLEEVQIGVDEFLDPITSMVLVEAAVPVVMRFAREMGPLEKTVFEVVQEIAESQTSGIEIKAVVAEAVKRTPPPDAGGRDTRKQRVRRALMKLCEGDDAPFFVENGSDTLEVV